MKIYKKLKKVPVTKLFSNIITAYASSSQSFEERTPFVVYLPCGTEGIAVGNLIELTDLMKEQSERRIERWNIVDTGNEHVHLTAECDFADIDVTLVIEPVATYVHAHLQREEEQQQVEAEEEDYENDTL